MAFTFATMKTLVADFLNRDDITDAQVGYFINAAMRTLEHGQFELGGTKVSHNWRALQKRQTTTGTSTDGVYDTYLTFPTRIKEVEFLKVFDSDASRWYDLTPKSPAVALALYPFDDAVTDRPVVFAWIIAQSQILLRPNPDAAYTYDCLMYAFSAELSGANDHNDWTDSHWEILLHGSLLQASPYLRDDPRIATWEKLYNGEVNALITQEREERLAGGMLTINAYMPSQLTGGGGTFNIDAC